MAKRRPSGDGMVRRRDDGRWEGRIVIGHKKNGDPIFHHDYANTQKEVMCRGHFIGQVDRLCSRLAVDEKKAGERTGAVNGPVHPTNARSAGIFKGL